MSRSSLSLAVLLLVATPALAAKAVPKPASPAGGMAGVPVWVPPAAYSERLVIESEGRTIVMERKLDHGRSRTDLVAEGQQIVMIEVGDEKGTSYMVMPGQKKAMKQSLEGNQKLAEGHLPAVDSTGKAEPEYTVEELGDETIDGIATKKLRMTMKDGDAIGWFDKATGAPLRMESAPGGKKSVISWKDRKVEPQPASQFEVPKDYEIMDMDALRSKMGAMGAMGGMAKGMAGGLAGGMGSGLGGNLGGMLGGSLGGPVGSLAGRFIGGKIGSALGHKAAGAVLH